METIGDARAFLSAAREVALTKPIIVIKPGRTAQAAKAAASHTGSLTGSDEVLAAAFRRVGVLRVDAIADIFDVLEVLAKQPRPRGNRLTIVTNAGGPGVLATDALITGGGEVSEISPATMEELNAFLPGPWSHNNPIDIIGDATPERYAKALEVAARDEGSDGLLVILTPQAMTDPTATARELIPFAHIDGKPVLASWMGGMDVARGGGDPPGGRYPHLRLPRRGGGGLQLHVAAGTQPPADLRDADAALRRGAPGRPGEGRRAHRCGAGGGPDAAHGGRVEGASGRLRDPDHGDGGRSFGGRRGDRRRPDRLPGRGQAVLAHDHPQDRRGRCPAEPEGRRRRAPRVRADPRLRDREEGSRALRGRHGPAHGQLDRLRAHPGQLHRSAVRAGAAVRHGRPARRGLQGPCPGPAAPDHDARPPDDGEHQDLHRPQGRARAAGRRPG